MQYSDIPFLKKGAVIRKVGFLLKSLILIFIVVFMVVKLMEHPVRVSMLSEALTKIFQNNSSYWLLIVAFLLSPLNWILEAFKWKVLVARIENVTLLAAFKGIITGLSLGFVTPHAVGDYLGRIWQLKTKERINSIGAIMLGRAAQYFATFTFGGLGVCYFLYFSHSPLLFYFSGISFFFVALFIGVILFLYFRAGFLKLLDVFKASKIKKYFVIINTYTLKEILLVLILAFIRYLIFVFQFYLLLYLFDVSNDHLLLLSGVVWTFLLKSSVPTFNFLSDLGIREFSALYFFSYFQTNNLLVVLSSFTLWCINILTPSFFGLIGVVRMRIFNKG